jgi:hypothetical protein
MTQTSCEACSFIMYQKTTGTHVAAVGSCRISQGSVDHCSVLTSAACALQMVGGLGRDSAQLSFGLRTLSLSSSAADHDGEEAANGAPAPAQPEEKDDPNESQNAKVQMRPTMIDCVHWCWTCVDGPAGIFSY